MVMKFEGGRSGAQPVLWWLTTWPNCRWPIACYIITYDVILLSDSMSQSSIVVAVGVISMRSTTVQCHVQYSNRFDTTAAILRRI